MRYGKMRNKRWLALITALSVLMLATACSGRGNSSTQLALGEGNPDHVQVEVLHLNHWPVKGVLDEIEEIVAAYDETDLQLLSFDSSEGKALAKERNIDGHTPLVVFINGEKDFQINGNTVSFYSFPDGSGTLMMGGGEWTMDDLDAALAQVTGGTP